MLLHLLLLTLLVSSLPSTGGRAAFSRAPPPRLWCMASGPCCILSAWLGLDLQFDWRVDRRRFSGEAQSYIVVGAIIVQLLLLALSITLNPRPCYMSHGTELRQKFSQ